MACLERAPLTNAESEMEEGEIVDDLDNLSDISSEEEFLLRQRLEVLENYNNVLERKEAKRTSSGPGIKKRSRTVILRDLSEISTSELEEVCTSNNKKSKDAKCLKTYSRQKKKREIDIAICSKKKNNRKKKKLPLKVISESSEESDDEYRNKRRKLANAVAVRQDNFDKSSLKSRLNNMIHGFNIVPLKIDKQTETEQIETEPDIILPSDPLPKPITNSESSNKENSKKECSIKEIELIDLSAEDIAKDCSSNVIDTVDGVYVNTKIETKNNDKEVKKEDSDEDLELLRQHALKTKSSKLKQSEKGAAQKNLNSEDEDSDTAELRLICLKSALLKKAIELKQKQKLRKRLSQSSSLQDDLLVEQQLLNDAQSNNNTDVESVDMDMGSDVDEKQKEIDSTTDGKKLQENTLVSKQDELDEDVDLLRAKLLTSLSKNLPNLVDPKVMSNIAVDSPKKLEPVKKKLPAPPIQEKKIIINLGESDSEGEHEATKNLTKMHMKLSEQIDFQQQLDLFLKSARMEVECNKLPDVVQKPTTPKTPTKYVPKAVKHLPKSEQIEYKSLIKRMAELEKVKQARQMAMNMVNNAGIVTDTLKPRNITVNTAQLTEKKHLDEQIALSRKRIAEESSKILKLKEEATKLTQKYKIVETELKNLGTAITFNKKEQRISQNRLTKIRLQHQSLLNRSNNKHSTKFGPGAISINSKTNTIYRQQKENNPKEEYKNQHMLKTFKVSVVNDFKDKLENTALNNSKISIEVDVTNNKKTVTLPKSQVAERFVDKQIGSESIEDRPKVPEDDRKEHNLGINNDAINKDALNKDVLKQDSLKKDALNKDALNKDALNKDDYQSPLQAFERASWNEDPNAILCPFEIGGNCKDTDCKYMHPKNPQNK